MCVARGRVRHPIHLDSPQPLLRPVPNRNIPNDNMRSGGPIVVSFRRRFVESMMNVKNDGGASAKR
jgi:hypothetical protein